MGNTAQHCRLVLLQDSDFAGDLEDSKTTSGSSLVYLWGSRTFVPNIWIYKKQKSVSHSSTESEILLLDAGLRMDGLPALDIWDVVIEVLRSSNSTRTPTNQLNSRKLFAESQIQTQTKRDTEMLINCRMWTTSPRTQILLKASLSCTSLKTAKQNDNGWLFDRIYLDPEFQIKCVDTRNQLADTLTKGIFTRDEWDSFFLKKTTTKSRVSCPRELRKARLKKVRQWRHRDQ